MIYIIVGIWPRAVLEGTAMPVSYCMCLATRILPQQPGWELAQESGRQSKCCLQSQSSWHCQVCIMLATCPTHNCTLYDQGWVKYIFELEFLFANPKKYVFVFVFDHVQNNIFEFVFVFKVGVYDIWPNTLQKHSCVIVGLTEMWFHSLLITLAVLDPNLGYLSSQM